MAAVEVLAQHGWGFDASCWDRWRDIMPADFALHCSDRGYFGRVSPALPDRLQIVMTHSLGLHMIAPEYLQATELVVVLGGFRHFHDERANLARRSRRTVQQMLARLQSEPEALLEDFYTRCGAANFDQMHGAPDLDLLRGDLQLLQDGALPIEYLTGAAQVLILHGGADRIVAVARASELHRLLPGSELVVLPEAEHALPLTHGRECWREVERLWRLRCSGR